MRLQRSDFGRRRNFWLAQGAELLAPLQRFIVRWLVPAPVTPPCEWRKGIILGNHHIGDLLWLTASLERLKQGLPNCDWYCLATSDSAPVLEGNPNVAGILTLYRSGSNLLSRHAIETIRAMRFDVALCTNKYQYSTQLAIALRARIPNRVSYINKGFGALATLAIPLPGPRPFPAYFRDFVATLIREPADWPLRPRLYLQENWNSECKRYLERAGITFDSRIAVVFTSSITSRTRLSEGALLAAMKELVERQGLHVILAGVLADRPSHDVLAAKAGGGIHVSSGKLSLGGVFALVGRALLVLSPDSGPRHIGNAMGVPVIYWGNLETDAVEKIEVGQYLATEVDMLAELTGNEEARLDSCVLPERLIRLIRDRIYLGPEVF